VNVIPEPMKLLEENIRETFQDLGMNKNFLGRTPK
jgi:hypothetical protein